MAEPGRELQNWLKALPNSMRRRLASKVEAQAERLATAQRAALTRLQQPPEETGGLLDSIRVESGKDELSFIVRAGGPLTTRDGYDHALAFEFGTKKQPARSFFYAPARALRSSMNRDLEEAVAEAIDRA